MDLTVLVCIEVLRVALNVTMCIVCYSAGLQGGYYKRKIIAKAKELESTAANPFNIQ